MAQATRNRREKIVNELLQSKHVTVRQIAQSAAVSEATVRRDLRALAQSQQVTLVHGGATLPRNPRHNDSSFHARQLRNLDAKRVIAALAADLVGDDDQILLDSGTTTSEMVPYLHHKQGLSVLVNSARLALELQAPSSNGTPAVNVIMLGGQYRPERMDTVGPIATSTLAQLRGYLAFIGADGLSIDFGPSANDIDSAHLYNLAVQNAREAVLLVDHTKFQSASLFRIVDWGRVTRVVTDLVPDRRWSEFFRESEIQVIYPPGE